MKLLSQLYVRVVNILHREQLNGMKVSTRNMTCGPFVLVMQVLETVRDRMSLFLLQKTKPALNWD